MEYGIIAVAVLCCAALLYFMGRKSQKVDDQESQMHDMAGTLKRQAKANEKIRGMGRNDLFEFLRRK